MKGLVSVIIPTFNAANYIKDAIESVLNQTYKEIEIIVVDDGSTDNTWEVIRPYLKQIQYIQKENGGPASARNKGLEVAQGEFVAFLDADDIWLEDKLEVQLNEMKEDIFLVGTDKDASFNSVTESALVTYEDLVIKNRFCNSSVLVRKECFDRLRRFDEAKEFKAVEDWDMWLRIAKQYKVKLIYQKLIIYRTTENSISSPAHAEKMLHNELAVLKKNLNESNSFSLKHWLLKKRAYGYRFFSAAWAYYVSQDIDKALKHILIAFFYNPLGLLDTKQSGLMIKILMRKILGMSIPVNQITKPVFSNVYKLHVLVREFFIWVLRFIYFEPLFRSQCKHVGGNLWMEQLPYMVGRGEIIIGDNVRLSGKLNVTISNKILQFPKLVIGDNTFVGHNTKFILAREIEIGRHCYIAGGVTIADNDGHPLDYDERRKNLPPEPKDVKVVYIGDDVWIGRDAFILKGVTIADKAVIGANAVVVQNVPEKAIVAGNPAKVIKYLE